MTALSRPAGDCVRPRPQLDELSAGHRPDQPGDGAPGVEPDDIRVRVAADGVLDDLVVGVEAALRAVTGWFDTHAYCADAYMWITWQDNDARSSTSLDRARLVRRPAREVLVVGADPVADQVRALLRLGRTVWRLHELPERQTLLEIAEPILDHRAYNMLTREGYRTLDEVAATPEASMHNIRNHRYQVPGVDLRRGSRAHAHPAMPDQHQDSGDAWVGPALDLMTTDQLRILWIAVVGELRRRGALPNRRIDE